MSYNYNPNFYNNFTFQNNYGHPPTNFSISPPPNLPRFLPPHAPRPNLSDEDHIKSFVSKITSIPSKQKAKTVQISQVRLQLRHVLSTMNKLKEQEKYLAENMSLLSETEWETNVDLLKRNKMLLEGLMIQINDTYLDVIKNSIAKRSAKRLRQKRGRVERKRLKEERKKLSEEMSRKIDENLQKIKDDIVKTKQDEEARINADIILREVTRKKQDAKKYIAKLEALIKLRSARQNTARGRGVEVSESDAAAFSSNIDKLKQLWIRKLSLYEKEEAELRDKMQKDSEPSSTSNETERKITRNVSKWRKFLFGADRNPQADFKGNAEQFIAVRSKWDQFIHRDGSSLPVGWVLPA